MIQESYFQLDTVEVDVFNTDSLQVAYRVPQVLTLGSRTLCQVPIGPDPQVQNAYLTLSDCHVRALCPQGLIAVQIELTSATLFLAVCGSSLF